MLCFVDESGDPGRKTDSGSSKYMSVALVLFQDKDEANACDARIDKLRVELNVDNNFEFHFSQTPDKKKIAFFEAVSTFNFFYLTITINKSALYGEGFKHKSPFYKYSCGLVFENAKAHLDNAIVILDGSGSRQFKQELQRYLKKRINDKDSKRIKKVKVQDSKKNNLIQLADMVCGAVVHSLKQHKTKSVNFRKMISHREIFCQIWPKELNEEKKAEYEKRKNKQ